MLFNVCKVLKLKVLNQNVKYLSDKVFFFIFIIKIVTIFNFSMKDKTKAELKVSQIKLFHLVQQVQPY